MLVVGVPSLIALLGAALTLTRVFAVYERAQALDQANTSSTFLIQAAAAQAKERGFTAAVLSDPRAQATRQQIPALRQRGDRLLRQALEASQRSRRGNRILQDAKLKLDTALHARDRKRAEVDAAFAGGRADDQADVQSWFDAQTQLILAERAFGSALFLAQNPYELVLQYNGFIKANVFEASEFAGRERARLGRFIASGQPIPPAALEELLRWRGVVEENLVAIGQLRANPAMPEEVVNSIGNMEVAFLGDYEKMRQEVYGASARATPYPLSTDRWIDGSTRAINAILAVSDHIGEEAARISRQQSDFSLLNVLLIAGLMVALLLAVAASVGVGRRLTRRFAELHAAAARVAAGNYGEPLPNDAGGGDEFGALARSFNEMQRRIQAGVEQLRAEKASVEKRVVERTQQLSSANHQLRLLNEEKNTFLGICSHDLKNPLSGIRGLADLIQRDPRDPALVGEYATDILRSADFMFELVANLLDVAAMEEGKWQLRPEPVDLGEAAEQAVENYRARAAGKRIELRFTRPPAELPRARADRQALAQIVDNLLSNAIKYTAPGGQVEVVCGERPADPGMKALSVMVRDTGPGLSAADQTRLFQKFARLSSRPTAGEHSSGLGLSIVKRLAEAMGGAVSCQSELGRGSVFEAWFPAG